MRIKQIAWSDKRRNHLVNFYALEPDSKGKVVVLNPPFSWQRKEDAVGQYNLERADKDTTPPYRGLVLHVIFDMSSGRLYLPDLENKSDFQGNPNLQAMLDAVKIKIEQLIDITPLAPLIRGDPLNTIRIRRLGDFKSVSDFVRRQVTDYSQFEKDIKLPVIEANMANMPKTATQVFGSPDAALRRQYIFVDGNQTVEFTVSEGVGTAAVDNVVHYEKAPFILINIDPKVRVSEADKERIVVLGYKEYAITNRPDLPSSSESPGLQSFKYLLYIGWNFRELCTFVLKPEDCPDFGTMMRRAAFIYNAAKSLHRDGYPDPTANPYYYSFKIGEDFPVQFRPESGVEVYSQDGSHDIFHFVYFDPKTSYVTIRTPLFLALDLVNKIFKSKSAPFIAQYDATDKILKTSNNVQVLDKTAPTSLKAMKLDLSEKSGTDANQIETRVWNLMELVYQKKHISDYPQAAEIIKNLCAKLAAKSDATGETKTEGVRFDDLEVVVGPFSEQYGFLGGYIDKETMKDHFKGATTIEPIPGLVVTPPVILIDNTQCPSVGDRTHVIIHEYQHHINRQINVKLTVNNQPKDGKTLADKVRSMVVYLQSPDERLAHKTQFKYMLAIGMSREQIMRHLFVGLGGGKPTITTVPLVKSYLSIIDEAAKEIAAENQEEATAEKVQNMFDKAVVDDGDGEFYEPNE